MSSFGGAVRITPAVKMIVIINASIWLLGQILLDGYGHLGVTRNLSLVPGKVLFDGWVWQLVTYMFLHSLQVGHILFNMLMLWFVGSDLEARWGKKFFVGFYLFSGVGAAVLYCTLVALYHLIFGGSRGLMIPVLGASGAIYGLLLAYGILFGERTIHFMMLFPMKARHFVMVLGGVEFVSFLSSGVAGGEVAYLAHLGGLASGWLGLWGWNSWQKTRWNQKLKKRNQRLKLVIDNDRDPSPSDGAGRSGKRDPKFWN